MTDATIRGHFATVYVFLMGIIVLLLMHGGQILLVSDKIGEVCR